MKKLYFVAALALAFMLAAAPAMATNGYQLIGVGQVQKSMGGAVTAAPLDAMTAISNPAGMSRVGKRADFSMEAFMPTRSVDFGNTGGAKTEGGTDRYGVPAIGWTAPAFNRDDVYFGGGMFGTSGLGVDYDEILITPALGGVTFSGYTAIGFWKMAPSVAWNVNDSLSIGAALNVDYQTLTIREKVTMGGSTAVNLDLGRPTNQAGFGASVGGIYDATDWLSVGAAYTTKQYFDEGEFRVGSGDVFGPVGSAIALGQPGIYKLDLEYPAQAAVGLAVRPHQQVLVAFDVKWINWSDTHDKVRLSGPSNSFDTNNDFVGDSDSTDLNFGWDDQWVYAVGLQYEATEMLTLRTGYNYSEAPIDEADVFNNLIFPAIVEQHFALGADYKLGAHWGIGATYMKAFKETLTGTNDVPVAFQGAFGPSSGAKISLEEDSVGMQLTYRF